jgi:hypothetical protein
LQVSSCVWSIAKNLPQDAMSIMARDSLMKLEKMCMDGYLRTDYQYIVECVLEWGFERKLLKMIQYYIDINETKTRSTSERSSNTKRRRTTADEDVPLRDRLKQGLVACSYLNSLVENQKSCKYLLMKAKNQMDSISNVFSGMIENDLKAYIQSGGTTVGEADREQYEIFMSTVFHTYPKLITHKLLKPTMTKKFQEKTKAKQVTQVTVGCI